MPRYSPGKTKSDWRRSRPRWYSEAAGLLSPTPTTPRYLTYTRASVGGECSVSLALQHLALSDVGPRSAFSTTRCSYMLTNIEPVENLRSLARVAARDFETRTVRTSAVNEALAEG